LVEELFRALQDKRTYNLKYEIAVSAKILVVIDKLSLRHKSEDLKVNTVLVETKDKVLLAQV
jgi:hypothetical protein